MAPKPIYLQLNDDDLPKPPRRTFHVDLPSPRAGDTPPALSPLDAFAMQSRLLAKRFEQQDEDGRRISRLPHQDVAREFAPRQGFFRTISDDRAGQAGAMTMTGVPELNEDPSGSRPTTSAGAGLVEQQPNNRPVSQYPVIGDATLPIRASHDPMPAERSKLLDAGNLSRSPPVPYDYFGLEVPRATSPEMLGNKITNADAQATSAAIPSLSSSIDTLPSTQIRKVTNGSQHSQHSYRSTDRGLLPPQSPRFPRSPRSFQSIRSVRQDSGDDDATSINGYPVSATRKFSGSSLSRPHSPFSPMAVPPPERSPSILSDHSYNTNSQHLQQRPQFANFSRPMSSASFNNTRISLDSRPSMDVRPSTDLPLREPSISNLSIHSSVISQPLSRQNSDEQARRNDGKMAPDGTSGSASYVYAKYPLPRGRVPDRDSAGQRASWINNQFSAWEQERAAGTKSPEPARPTTSHGGSDSGGWDRFRHQPDAIESEILQQPSPMRKASPAGSARLPDRRPDRFTTDASSTVRSQSAGPKNGEFTHRASPSVQSESTDQTIRQAPLHERHHSAELTPEEHLNIGIQAHDAGQLSKSTYHLRLAARAGLPTAMLLYALACRHGWGMRPNQEDGVTWLRKAIESSQLELSDIEAAIPKSNRQLDHAAELAERRKRKAQFALAIYELGNSYMNGWGCPKDKALAVRCYEVAGSWGDCDALAEAGFCYAQGQGVKKDMKKAAALYRKAADGGMSMAGYSWIYKPKYMDDNDKTGSKSLDKVELRPSTSHTTKDAEKNKEKQDDAEKAAGRPRSRSIWGRRKEKEKS